MANEVINPDVLKDVETKANEAKDETPNNTPENDDKMPFIYEDKIKWLLNHGYKKISKLKVRNIITNMMDEYLRITFVTNKPIKGMVENDEGEYEEADTNNVFTSNYALAGTLKENLDYAWLGNYIAALSEEEDEDDENNDIHLKQGALALFFCGSEIDVIQTRVKANEDYINPFSTSDDPTVTNKDHDWFATTVINITPCKKGDKAITRFADKIMGF